MEDGCALGLLTFGDRSIANPLSWHQEFRVYRQLIRWASSRGRWLHLLPFRQRLSLIIGFELLSLVRRCHMPLNLEFFGDFNRRMRILTEKLVSLRATTMVLLTHLTTHPRQLLLIEALALIH